MTSDPRLVELTTATSAIEAEWLVGALKEQGVHAVAFGGLLVDEFAMSQKAMGLSGGVRVMVPKEELERAGAVLSEIRRDRPTAEAVESAPWEGGADAEQEVAEEPDAPAWGGAGRTATIVVLAAAVVALGGLALWQHGRITDMERASPVTEYAWRGDGWETRWRDNGRRASLMLDRDLNGVSEEYWIFDRQGRLVSKAFDENQNAVWELMVETDPGGEERVRALDADENCVPERVEYPAVDGVQERWIDADQDRRYERHEFVDVLSGEVLDAFEDRGRQGFLRVKGAGVR